MQSPEPHKFRHSHEFGADTSVSESRTRIVIAITATMMVAEIAAGMAFNSMALLADGWHMSTHVAAFMITLAAYRFSRRHAKDPRYTFGTGKIGVLGGFASAVVLFMVALLMVVESVHRFFDPAPIRFVEAIGVAVIGLLVNIACALLLKDDHHHGHGHHGHDHGHHGHGHDLNRRAAYMHVLADALTSVTAIFALLAGLLLGWSWMDPVMGIVGSAVVISWAVGLVRETSGILLDRTPDASDLPDEIRRAVEDGGDAVVSDLHVWQVAAGKFAAIVSIVSETPKPAGIYHAMFREHDELVHVTVEVRTPDDHASGVVERE